MCEMALKLLPKNMWGFLWGYDRGIQKEGDLALFRYRTSDIIKSDLKALKKEGIKALVFDIDGTIISLSDVVSDISLQVSGLIKTARKLGFEIFIVSNTTDLGKKKEAKKVLKLDK